MWKRISEITFFIFLLFFLPIAVSNISHHHLNADTPKSKDDAMPRNHFWHDDDAIQNKYGRYLNEETARDSVDQSSSKKIEQNIKEAQVYKTSTRDHENNGKKVPTSSFPPQSMQVESLTDYSINFLDAFQWMDIFSGEFNVTVIVGSDQAREVAIPFVFKFYEAYTTSIYVTSSGWITFNVETLLSHFTGKLVASSFPLKSGLGKYLVAPLFTDYFQVNKENVEQVTIVAISDQIVVIQYEVMDKLVTTSDNNRSIATFQVVLGVNGSIYFNYRHVASRIIDLYQTTIGLNRGDGLHFNEIDPNSILREENVSVKFSYPQLDQDVAVRITTSSLYFPVTNRSQNISIVVTNLGKREITNFTVITWLNQTVIANLTYTPTNENSFSQLNSGQSRQVTVRFTLPSEQVVNITAAILPVASDGNPYHDQNDANNRHQVLFRVVDERSLPSIRVQAIIANESLPLEGATITIKETHGLLEVKGITDDQGFYNTSNFNLKSDVMTDYPWIMRVIASHEEWGTASAEVTLDASITNGKNENITKIYLGPGKVLLETPITTNPITRGIYPITIAITPREKTSEIINFTVATNANYAITYTDLPFQNDANDSNRQFFVIHVPLSLEVARNVITLTFRWQQGFITRRMLVTNYTLLEPLFNPQPGDWITYLHDRPIKEDQFYNITFLQWLSTTEILVKATINSIDNPTVNILTEHYAVNVYNGLINKSSLLIDSNYQRFFFLTGLTNETAYIGTIFNLNDWITPYEIVSKGLDRFGGTWISFDTKAHFSSNARILISSGLVTYFVDNGVELELLNSSFLGFPRKNIEGLEIIDDLNEEQFDVIKTVLNLRIPSLTISAWLSGLITVTLIQKRKQRRTKK